MLLQGTHIAPHKHFLLDIAMFHLDYTVPNFQPDLVCPTTRSLEIWFLYMRPRLMTLESTSLALAPCIGWKAC